MIWQLPPDIPWPQFLKLLRRPNPPREWLEAAADIPDVRKKPMLLRWIAQHRSSSSHLRVSLISRLPWRALAEITWDPIAHPQARAQSVERLQLLWAGLAIGERRTFAGLAPRQMWPLVWKIKDSRVISAFLRHPKLSLEMLISLIQAPISATHIEALQTSHLKDIIPIARQIIFAIEKSLLLPDHGLVPSMAAQWIRKLDAEYSQITYSELKNPLLRGMIEKTMNF